MPIKTQKKKKHKVQNRPSEIRLSGVPPIMQDLKNMIHKLGLQANRSWMGRMVKKDFKT